MSAAFELTFLGTGTSVGIPMIGCDCETCRSDDPRDKRLRRNVSSSLIRGLTSARSACARTSAAWTP
jgi:phosphoribosyl 1,2-cyclic phosphodiesterase